MVPPTPTNTMRVFIVSRNELLIKEVSAILESENHFIVEETHDPEDGVSQAVKFLQPDIILYDYQYSPPEETFDTIDDIAILHPNVATIVIIPNEEVANANRVILAGARAFLPYPFSRVNLLSTLHRVNELNSRFTATTAQPAAATSLKFSSQRNFLVFSPKGGVGCTTCATNLAIAMYQESDEEILLVDGKLLFGDIGLMLNLKTANSIVDLIPHAGSLDEALVRQVVIRHTSGIQVLPSPFSASVAQTIRPDDLYRVIQGLQNVFPNVIVDGGNYLNDEVVTMMDSSQRVILVITPDLASLRNARLFLDICRSLSYPREKILLVMNRVSGKNDVAISEVEKVLRTKVFGVIPEDEAAAQASLNEGVPLLVKKPNHAISKAFRKIGKSLVDIAPSAGIRSHAETTPDVLLKTSRLG